MSPGKETESALGFPRQWVKGYGNSAVSERGLTLDAALALGDNAVNGGESEAGGEGGVLGGEKRFEDTSAGLLRSCRRRYPVTVRRTQGARESGYGT